MHATNEQMMNVTVIGNFTLVTDVSIKKTTTGNIKMGDKLTQ
jgi:hypothetical protein